MPQATNSGERYTPEELAHIREHYATRRRNQLARELGRAPLAITCAAWKLGLAKRPKLTEQIAGVIRRLHAQGKNDRVIAKRLRVSACVAGCWRRRLNLASNYTVEARRQQAQREQRRRGRENDVKNFTTLQHEQRRLAANRAWPGCTSQLQVLCCQELARGPATAVEIARVIGWAYSGVFRALFMLLGFGLVRREKWSETKDVRGRLTRWRWRYELVDVPQLRGCPMGRDSSEGPRPDLRAPKMIRLDEVPLDVPASSEKSSTGRPGLGNGAGANARHRTARSGSTRRMGPPCRA